MRSLSSFMLVGMFSGLLIAQGVTLQKIEAQQKEDQMMLLLQGDKPLIYTTYHKDPQTFVVELPDTDLGFSASSVAITGSTDNIDIQKTAYSLQLLVPAGQDVEPQIQSRKDSSELVFLFPLSHLAVLKEVETLIQKDKVDLIFHGKELKEPTVEYLDNPTRVVLDFSNTLYEPHHKSIFLNLKDLEKIRLAQLTMEPVPVARIVLETTHPFPVEFSWKNDKKMARVNFSLTKLVEEGAPLASPQAIEQDVYEPKAIGKEEIVYTGEPIELHLKNADIQDVLATFSQFLDLNIVIDPDVKGTVSINVVGVPWDQVLDLILKVNGLSYVIENNVMRVAKASKLAAEAQQKRNLEKEQELSQPLNTVIKRLSYARATNIQATIKKVMSQRGDLLVDDRTNTLIIREIPKYLPRVLDLIEALDISTPQVTIEARIVETTKNFIYQLGVDWGFQILSDVEHGNTTGLKFPNTYNILGDITLPAGVPLLDMTFGNILGTFNLDLSLSAAESDGLAKIVSAPRVTTQDNLQAMIQSGVQIPVQTTANNTTTVQYIDATLQLQVTPQITAEGTIIMQINVQKREPLTALGLVGGTNVPLSTRQAQTQVMVKDGGTTVIGGIYQLTDNVRKNRIPFLHRIPIIGNLFKNYDTSSRHDELLIFISPRIVKNI